MTARRSRRTMEQIETLLAEFNKGSKTIKEFCLANNVSKGTFHKWQARSKGSALKKPDRPGFARVVVDSSPLTLFAEVNGIRFYQMVSAAYLKELIV